MHCLIGYFQTQWFVRPFVLQSHCPTPKLTQTLITKPIGIYLCWRLSVRVPVSRDSPVCSIFFASKYNIYSSILLIIPPNCNNKYNEACRKNFIPLSGCVNSKITVHVKRFIYIPSQTYLIFKILCLIPCVNSYF